MTNPVDEAWQEYCRNSYAAMMVEAAFQEREQDERLPWASTTG